ncbi:MAG: rhodanese-like domain-containing protein [Chloroflexi bacterium]|nr:rhodanese-like domain-containing protein [Chloroflexota bacterium]
MDTRKILLIAMLFVLAITAIACAPAPAPVPASTMAPPMDAPKPTTAPTLAPTIAPTVAPTTAPAAFDIKTVLVKYVTTLPDGFGGVQPAALKDQMAAAKPFILDVREASEIATNGFIEGAVNIPIRTLTKNLDKLPAKDQPIVTLCASGQRGGIAMSVLQMLGYTNVKNLVGGFNAWKAANLPVATGAPAEAKAGKSPEFDKDLFAALDKYVTTLPDGFGGAQPAALKDQMAATKVFLLDVREPSEITQNGFIEGSVNVPMRTVVNNLDKLPGDKAAPIVTYCPTGQRGDIAMVTLQLLGYTNVKNLVGGFGAWKNANLPIAK